MSDSPPRPGAEPPDHLGEKPRRLDLPQRQAPLDPLALANELLAQTQAEKKPLDPLALANELLAQTQAEKKPLDPLALANELLAQTESTLLGPPPSAPEPPASGAIQAPRFDPLNLSRLPREAQPVPPTPPAAAPAQPPPPQLQRPPATQTQRMQAVPPQQPPAAQTQRMQAVPPQPPPAAQTQRMQAVPPAAEPPAPPAQPPPARPDAGTTQKMQVLPKAEPPKSAGTTQKMQAFPRGETPRAKPAPSADPWRTALDQSEKSAPPPKDSVTTQRMQAIRPDDKPPEKPRDSITTQKMAAMGNVTRLMPAVEDPREKKGSEVSAVPTQRIQGAKTNLVSPPPAMAAAPRPGQRQRFQPKPATFWELQVKRLRRIFDRRERINTDDVVVFTRQFSAMVTAGLQLHQSLYFYAENDPDGALNRIVHDVADRVGEGNSLSHAMRRYPDVFSEVYTGLIAAGESTGMLSPVLSKLADLSEKNQRIRKKVWSTLTYPMVLLCVSGMCILAFLYFVLPMMVPLFTTLSVDLPLPTRILVMISEVMKNPVTVALLFLGPILLWFLWPVLQTAIQKDPERLRALHRLPLSLPWIGRMTEKIITARIMFSMATLLDSGYALNATLEKCEKVAGNAEIAWRLRMARQLLVEGCSAAECLGRAGVFPHSAIQMIAVGEEAASLSDMITRVARVYEDEVELTLLDLAALLEPLILIGMGVVVGFLVLAAVMPTIQLLNNL